MTFRKIALSLLLTWSYATPVLASEYTIPQYNITLTYPNGWQNNTSHEKGSLVLGGINVSPQTGMQFRMYKTRKDIESFIDWYVKDYIQ